MIDLTPDEVRFLIANLAQLQVPLSDTNAVVWATLGRSILLKLEASQKDGATTEVQ